jgi:hypothetical protein
MAKMPPNRKPNVHPWYAPTAHAEASAELGLLCPAAGGSCSGLTRFEAERDFEFEFIAPDPTEQFKLELGAKGFVFARPSIGSKFSAKTQFAFLEATAGIEQSVDLATATHQVTETDYASGFLLEGKVDVGPGKDLASAIDKLGDLLGVDLDIDLALVDIDETLGESPKGTFTITPASVEPGNDMALGDMATFTIDLDPVTYLGIESVDRVEIFWKKDDGNGGFTLEPGRPGCTDISGSSGQTKFECETDFLEEHVGEQSFYAFVHAKMFGVQVLLPLEVADDAIATVSVGEPECRTVEGLPAIFTQTELNELTGVCRIIGNLLLHDNASDPIIDLSPLSRLRRVSGGIDFFDTSLTAIDLAMDSIRGDMLIQNNPLLTSLSLRFGQIEGSGHRSGLQTKDNPALASISIDIGAGIPAVHLERLPALEELSVAVAGGDVGRFFLSETGLETITKVAVQRVGMIDGDIDGLWIQFNPDLSDIDALNGVTYIDGPLVIQHNPALCVPNWVDDVEATDFRHISNNKTDGC